MRNYNYKTLQMIMSLQGTLIFSKMFFTTKTKLS